MKTLLLSLLAITCFATVPQVHAVDSSQAPVSKNGNASTVSNSGSVQSTAAPKTAVSQASPKTAPAVKPAPAAKPVDAAKPASAAKPVDADNGEPVITVNPAEPQNSVIEETSSGVLPVLLIIVIILLLIGIAIVTYFLVSGKKLSDVLDLLKRYADKQNAPQSSVSSKNGDAKKAADATGSRVKSQPSGTSGSNWNPSEPQRRPPVPSQAQSKKTYTPIVPGPASASAPAPIVSGPASAPAVAAQQDESSKEISIFRSLEKLVKAEDFDSENFNTHFQAAQKEDRSDIQSFAANLAALAAKLEPALKELARVKQELAEAQENLTAAQQELNDVKPKYEQVGREKAEAYDKIKKLEADLDTANKAIKEKEADLDTANKAINEKENALEKVNKEKAEAIERVNKEKAEALERVSKEKAEALEKVNNEKAEALEKVNNEKAEAIKSAAEEKQKAVQAAEDKLLRAFPSSAWEFRKWAEEQFGSLSLPLSVLTFSLARLELFCQEGSKRSYDELVKFDEMLWSYFGENCTDDHANLNMLREKLEPLCNEHILKNTEYQIKWTAKGVDINGDENYRIVDDVGCVVVVTIKAMIFKGSDIVQKSRVICGSVE